MAESIAIAHVENFVLFPIFATTNSYACRVWSILIKYGHICTVICAKTIWDGIGLNNWMACGTQLWNIMGFPRCKKTKWQTTHPEDVRCPTPSSIGLIFAGKIRVISGHQIWKSIWNKLKIILWRYWPFIYEWLSKYAVFNDVISLYGNCRNNGSHGPHGKSFNLLQIYFCMW